jgi:hypothetical protein
MPVSLLEILVLVAWVVTAAVCGVSSTLIVWRMVDEVNVHLPDSEKFLLYDWSPRKSARLFQQYRSLYPSGRCIAQLRALWLLMVLSMVVAQLTLGFGIGSAVFLGVGGCLIAWLWFRN